MPQVFRKDPDAVKDYKFDWSDWLASGETIASAVITVPTGITNVSDSITDTNTSVTVWLSGGTAGRDYKIQCRVTTSNSPTARVEDAHLVIQVRNG